jgi:hypothetical protein
VPTHGCITIENMELHKIIASSFRIQDSTVVGPAWIDSARYTIVAKGPDPTVGSISQTTGFKLEPRTGPVDFLVIDQVEKPSKN